MSLFLTDFDQWYDEYEAASPRQQHELLKTALTQPIPIDYAEEVDLGSILIDAWDSLLSHNQVDQALELAGILEQQQPEFYQTEFHYFSDFLIQYHLFYNQADRLSHVLDQLKINCIRGIDQLIAALDDLCFYSATDPLLDLCRSVYQPVATSSELIGGTEGDFGSIVIADLFEQAHQQLQQGETVDWEALAAEAEQYGFNNTPAIRAEVEHNLTVELEGNSEFLKRFGRDRGSAIRQLMLGFCRHMSEQGMGFVTSQAIWSAILECLEDRDLPKKQLAHPDSYFAITQQALDRSVARKIGGFLSLQQSKGFAILWGIPYFYGFLQTKQIIEDRIAQRAITAANALKPQLIQAFQNRLWRYDFVHRWPCPKSMSATEFAAEAEQFAATIEQSEPLSDQPIEYPNWNPNVKSIAEEIMPNPDTPVDRHPPVKPPTWDPPRFRKSPLQEARELPDQRPPSNPKSGKKKKGKGFS